MSAWDLTRRGVAKPSPPAPRPKLIGMEPMPNNHLATQPMVASYWHDKLMALIEGATRADGQLPLNLDTANLVQSLPLLLLADKQPLSQVGSHQTIIDSLASYCSRSLTPSPSTPSSHSNSAESSLEMGPLAKGASHLPLLIKASAPTADSTFCSSLSSYSSSGSSSCDDSSKTTNDCSQLDLAHKVHAPDRRARKKDQNRRAAFNYRRKKMEERDKMLEEEARLVHRHVRLVGKIARLEEKIVTMLRSRTTRISNSAGKLSGHLCPSCSKPCDTVAALRTHLKTKHFPETMPQPERTEALLAEAKSQHISAPSARLVLS